MSPRPITKHYQVLAVLYRCEARKYSPTLAELRALCGIKGEGTANFYLRKLIAEGLIARERHSRNIILLEPAFEFMKDYEESGVENQVTEMVTAKIDRKAKEIERELEVRNKKRKSAEECFEAAVKLGLRRNAVVSADVTLDRGPLFRNRTFATKIG